MSRISVQGLAGQGGAVEGFTSGDNREIEFLEQFFKVVLLGRSLRWLVDGGDSFQGLAHYFQGLRVHRCYSFRGRVWAAERRVSSSCEHGLRLAPGALPALEA